MTARLKKNLWQRLRCLCLLPFFLGAGPTAAEITIVHAGRLLAEPGNAPLPRHSIVIEDDRITEVSPGFIDLPRDAADLESAVRIVDLSTSFVLPGLIDSHVHLASAPEPEGPQPDLVQSQADLAITASLHAREALQAGFTTVVDLGAAGVPGHEQAIFAVRDAVRRGKIPGPRILAAGTPVAASGLERVARYRAEVSDTLDFRATCNGAEDCRRAVRHQVKRGADVIVFFNTGSLLAATSVPQAMSDAEMRAIVETAHALGRKVIADGHHAAGIAAADRAGADILDSLHLYDESTFRSLRNGVFVQSHIHGVVRAVGDTKATLHEGLWGWLPDSILERFLAVKSRPFAVVEAYRAGVRNISYASDAGVYPWGDNAADLAEFVSRGIAPRDAIVFATSNPARMLGLEADVGTIAAGRKADLIATGGNPLDDITELRHVTFVMRDGVVHRHDQASGSPVN